VNCWDVVVLGVAGLLSSKLKHPSPLVQDYLEVDVETGDEVLEVQAVSVKASAVEHC